MIQLMEHGVSVTTPPSVYEQWEAKKAEFPGEGMLAADTERYLAASLNVEQAKKIGSILRHPGRYIESRTQLKRATDVLFSHEIHFGEAA